MAHEAVRMTDEGWFSGRSPEDESALAAAVSDGRADAPADWPALAVDSGFAEDEETYYEVLRAATIRATRERATERERAADQQLVHAVRAMDDMGR